MSAVIVYAEWDVAKGPPRVPFAVSEKRVQVHWHTTLKKDPCPYCAFFNSKTKAYRASTTLEHVIPRSAGGGTVNNVVGACALHNNGRRSMPLLRYLLLLQRQRNGIPGAYNVNNTTETQVLELQQESDQDQAAGRA